MRDSKVSTQQCLKIDRQRTELQPERERQGSPQRGRDSRREGDDGEECQNAQERQELPVRSQTEPVWRRVEH